MHKVLENLSPIQRKAAQTYGKDLVVTAGAGAGKTRVLVSRYLYFNLILGWDFSEILAITFTEKAAAEMKDRVREKLLELGEDPAGLDTAYISTFHSFCTRMLKEYPELVGLDPEFVVLDELKADVLLHKAVRGLITAGLEVDPPDPDIATLITMLADGVPSRLVNALVEAYQKWQESGLSLAEVAELSTSITWEDVRQAQEKVAAVIDSLLPLGPQISKRNLKKFNQMLEVWNEVSCDILTDNPQELAGVLTGCGRLLECQSKAEELAEHFNIIHTATKELQGLAASFYAQPLIGSLLTVLEKVDADYRRAKAGENGLDFTDLILEARNLFRNPAVRKELQGRFKAILVDEYQDTNGLQKELLDLIRAENTLFVVGDPKQSIYRFRGAEVEVFSETAQEVVERGGETITLHENYRSRGELLAFSNQFFAGLFTAGSVCDIEYTKITNMRPGSKLPRVEVLSATNEASVGENRTIEAKAIAYRIYEMVNSGEKLVFEKDEAEEREIPRPVRYGDIALLFRSKGDIDLYYSALRSLGIPALNLAGTDFFFRREIKDVLACLRAVADPEDELSLAVALRSPLFALSDPELWQLKQEYGSFSEAVYSASSLAENVPQGLAEARTLLRRLHPLARRTGPTYFVDKLLSETGYPQVVLAGEGGEQAYANLRKFQQMVEDLERAGLSDLETFLEYVDNLIRTAGKENEAQLVVEGEDAVKLMTVHASKGLEFKVVFVVDGSRGIEYAGFPPPLVFDKRDGFGLRFYQGGSTYATSKYIAIRERDKLADYQEAKRIFYVAATRAEDYLVLSGIQSKDRGDKLAGVDSARNWLEWVQLLASEYETVWQRDLLEYLADAEERLGEVAATEEPVPESSHHQTVQRVSIDWESQVIPVGVSDLLRLNHCPRSFYYQRVLGLPQRPRLKRVLEKEEGAEDKPSVDPILRGNLAHLACAQLRPGEAVPDLLSALAAELGIPAGQKEAIVAEVAPLIQRFQASSLFERLQEASWSAVEEPFLFKLEGLEVRGTIDRLAVFPGGKGLLIDYKTNQVSSAGAVKETEYYKLQLQLYAAAVREIYKDRVSELEVGIYYLVPGEYVEIPELSREELSAKVRELKKYLVPGEISDYPRKTGDCGYCAYASYCLPGAGYNIYALLLQQYML
ncbi:MAG: UvrD-helicase domain-containing protein [Firmicutes bacterium]|nr:UvrD-helicase domain-containing protein [Bacillota bacterium]